ncbi:hypothetical protein GWI33_005172 [Rhynchophorus ferrugineus]|uniref:Uncharacterized protein n=1 Tax=Rhynchophorus ferrugineus TaxID=354439 RepID=A0A834MK00_RHYFE|nr:hypothetical protein GWI33_005172 [Rhynchophorus ferrugineus]
MSIFYYKNIKASIYLSIIYVLPNVHLVTLVCERMETSCSFRRFISNRNNCVWRVNKVKVEIFNGDSLQIKARCTLRIAPI